MELFLSLFLRSDTFKYIYNSLSLPCTSVGNIKNSTSCHEEFDIGHRPSGPPTRGGGWDLKD